MTNEIKDKQITRKKNEEGMKKKNQKSWKEKISNMEIIADKTNEV